jgi:ornithine cyclodeaminase/alanine dehydrogenase-like protein (mu-crystallin family)
MAPKSVSSLCIMGTGHHSRTQLLGAVAVRRFDEIRVYSRSPDNRRRFVEKMAPVVGQAIRDCASAEEAVRGADVVMSASNSATPIYDAAWIAPNAYVGSAGPKFRTTSELPKEIAARATYLCTDTPKQFEAYRDNHFLTGTADFDRVTPLNRWLDEETRPKDPKGIRLFMLTGLSGTEVITGAYVIRAARRARAG